MKKITFKPRGKDNNFSRIGTGLSIQDGVLSAQGGASVIVLHGELEGNNIVADAGSPSAGEIVTHLENGGMAYFYCDDEETASDTRFIVTKWIDETVYFGSYQYGD